MRILRGEGYECGDTNTGLPAKGDDMKQAFAYTVLNSQCDDTILFLHGFMGAGRDWAAISEALPERRCLLVDLPAHGASVGLEDAAYTMLGATRGVLDVLDALAIERCHLVGYSMGGRLALYLALEQPERWQSVVLESASPGLRTAEAQAHRRRVDAERAAAIVANFPDFLERWYRQPLFASLQQHPGLVKRLVAQRLANDPAELGRSLAGMGTGAQPSLWERLSALEVPTYALAGALDPKYIALAHEMVACSPNLHATIVPRAGHNIHAERPDAYLTALSECLI